jgi:DNA polymerase
VTDVLKGMLRPALIPAPGKKFIVADWSSIEARCNPWLSEHPKGEDVLDVFRAGRDIYVREAAGIFHVAESAITPDMRQVGKVAILACGFAGGDGAFAAMGKVYGLSLPQDEAKATVKAWRLANQWAVNFWSDLEVAYMGAMRNPHTDIKAGRITYMFDEMHLWYMLPSRRVLCYPFARVEDDKVTYAKAAWKPAAGATEWPRGRLWKGLACENVTQACAADLLRFALRQLDNVVLHVHDEIVVEGGDEEELRQAMCTPPPWAAGLPLNIDIKTMDRYGK